MPDESGLLWAQAVADIVVEAFLAFECMVSIAALIGRHVFLGFTWLLLPVSTVLSAAMLEVCHSFAFVRGGLLDEVDILSACIAL